MYDVIRDIKNTVLYYIKNVSLSDYIETYMFNLSRELDTSRYVVDPDEGYIPLPGERGRGFCPFNTASGIFGECTVSSGIEVYDSMEVINPYDYIIEYTTASVVALNSVVPVAIKAPWHYVSVVEEWPEGDIPSLPLVVISPLKFNAEGYQLGGGKKPLLNYNIFVFATSTSELDDLCGKLFDSLYLRSVELYTFDSGDMFNSDGTYNYDFDCSTSFNPAVLYFEDVSIKYTRFKLYDSFDINMYRAQVDFVVTAYIEPE